MKCTMCKSQQFKKTVEVGDDGDVEQTVCSAPNCGFIMKEVVVVENSEGEETRRQRRVSKDSQPANLGLGETFTQKQGEKQTHSDELLSATEMMELAIKTQNETVGKVSRNLAKTILVECAKNVLAGEHTHLISEEEDVPGAVISQVVVELKGKGYKVKKVPCPGKGTEIVVKWPTQKKKPRVPKSKEVPAQDVPPIKKSKAPRRTEAQKAQKQKRDRQLSSLLK